MTAMLYSGESLDTTAAISRVAGEDLKQAALRRAEADGRSLVTADDVRAVAGSVLLDLAAYYLRLTLTTEAPQ